MYKYINNNPTTIVVMATPTVESKITEIFTFVKSL